MKMEGEILLIYVNLVLDSLVRANQFTQFSPLESIFIWEERERWEQ